MSATFKDTNFPYESIAAMNAGDFWASPGSLQVSAEDAAFLGSPLDAIPPDTCERVRSAALLAAMALRNIEAASQRPS